MTPEDQKNMTTQWYSTGRLFTAATQALNTSCSKSTFRKENGLYTENTITRVGPTVKAHVNELKFIIESKNRNIFEDKKYVDTNEYIQLNYLKRQI